MTFNVENIIDAYEVVQHYSPLVQCITNPVVPNMTANVLVACGAAPAMVDNGSEAHDFAMIANGLLINLGIFMADVEEGMRAALQGAQAGNTPWVLDPVGVGGLPLRTAFAHEIMQYCPNAVRGNASEVIALAGLGAGGRGVDATDSVQEAIPAAKAIVDKTKHVVAISGVSDCIVSRDEVWQIDGGHELMPKVIGTGCSLGALVAAYIGAAKIAGIDEFTAVMAAHSHVGAAGAIAGKIAQGPGTFAVAYLDALYNVTPEEIIQYNRYTQLS